MKQFRMMLVLIVALASCKHNPAGPDAGKPIVAISALDRQVVDSGNSFGFKLFHGVSSVENGRNVFISPFSVSVALGMTLNGANGQTLASMKKVLEDENLSMDEINDSYKNVSAVLTSLDPSVTFNIANAIWCKNSFPFIDAFKNICRQYVSAQITGLDFASPDAVTTINNWVDEKTTGKIPTIIDNIPPGTVMYLINAIYFKGTWTYQFKTDQTQDARFTSVGGTNVPCRLMSQRATFSYFADSTLQSIDLPYGNRGFSMTIILPSVETSIDQFAADLSQQRWNTLLGRMDSSKVDLSLPKFALEYKRKLNDELAAMGMGVAFSDAADFSRMSPIPLEMSEVVHKTFVQIDEQGTEAAAATEVAMQPTMVFPAEIIPVMRIDHPFIFAIREHASGTILFIGKIVNPNP